jgi:hypothetical protein
MTTLFENRYGNVHTNSGSKQMEAFYYEFDANYAAPLLESHLKLVLSKRNCFVGTKTLCSSLKFVQIALKHKKTRVLIKDHIQTILYEITLPMMLLSQHDYELWSENPIEYVRMQVDQSNSFNPKHTVLQLIKTICNIKATRKQKVSVYLQGYLQILASNLEQTNSDPRVKEAVLHGIGTLNDQIAASEELQLSIEPLLQNYVFSELTSSNAMMRARACWVYGQFGKFPFNNQDHLRGALNAIYENLHHQDLPVRVESALALNNLLNHEIAVEFIRPGLESLLKTYLKIMDDIDFDALVQALQNIVDIYQNEIAPYAVGLCSKLGEAFIRLITSKGAGENED